MKKYFLIIEVTPDSLKCVATRDNEADATRTVARWNNLESGFNPPEKIHYRVLTLDMAYLTNQLEIWK